LLEVLAAVAVLGIVFTMLASVTITGLSAEGTNLRRLRASLVADAALNELEVQMLSGVYPEESSQESEHDDFRIQVDVKPLADAGFEAGEADLVGFLEERAPDVLPLLRVIEVRVSWLEGEDHELTVRRTTCFFDETQWGETFPELEGPEGLPGELAGALPQGASR
jgi:hypothetical protein